jgi:hypothetical protein
LPDTSQVLLVWFVAHYDGSSWTELSSRGFSSWATNSEADAENAIAFSDPSHQVKARSNLQQSVDEIR